MNLQTLIEQRLKDTASGYHIREDVLIAEEGNVPFFNDSALGQRDLAFRFVKAYRQLTGSSGAPKVDVETNGDVVTVTFRREVLYS